MILRRKQRFVQRVKSPFLYWLPVVGYCCLIFILSSGPGPDIGPDLPHSDKVLHFAAFAVLGALCLRALGTTPLKKRPAWLIAVSVLAASLYGISDEVHQSFVPSRSADIMDAAADVFGSVFGVLVWRLLAGRRCRR